MRKRSAPVLHKEEKKDRYLREKYGLTLKQYRQMEFDQKGRCKICLRLPKAGGAPLHTDHDHGKSQRVRGLLCWRCNHRLLGRGLDQAWLHQAAVEYLLSDFDGRLLPT